MGGCEGDNLDEINDFCFQTLKCALVMNEVKKKK